VSYRRSAIILKRRPASDESIYLDTLLDEGALLTFKIPGILKSAKRSSFHFAPGAIYEFEWTPSPSELIIPKNSFLLFSPYAEVQHYDRLFAVAEILQTADYIRHSPDNAEAFTLLSETLRELPSIPSEIDGVLDKFYWHFLEFLGLAADFDHSGDLPVAYDLASGYITERELASRPATDFVLPYPWGGKVARELIRKFLKQI